MVAGTSFVCPRFGDNKKGNENLILPCFCWRQ
jgi:hypothetical protein